MGRSGDTLGTLRMGSGLNAVPAISSLKLGGFTWELDPEVPLDVTYIV